VVELDQFEPPAFRALDRERIQQLLESDYFARGERLVYLPTVDSTNTVAMRLAQDGSEEGVVVVTDSQTAGKGRQGRRWIDVSGQNVLTSIVLRPVFPPYLLIMVASLALVQAIADTCAITASIKWPNDILIEDHKVSGILIETRQDPKGQLIAIVGIGVNVNGKMPQLASMFLSSTQTEPTPAYRAITLEEASGTRVEREQLLAHLLKHIENFYFALQQEANDIPRDNEGPISRLIREQWRQQLSTLGRTVQVRQGDTFLSGVAEDVNERGELLLRIHSGHCICITWGDVAVLPGL
jgi:BirA family biotin operon repressor/biotin-[acetyl-CoA-carboxylase] ligase